MKKIIAITLTVLFALSCLVNLSFADEILESESNSIKNTVVEALTLYDLIGFTTHITTDEFFEDQIVIFIAYNIESQTEVSVGKYCKTVFNADTDDEVYTEIDKYFYGHNREDIWAFVDTDYDDYKIRGNSIKYVDFPTDKTKMKSPLFLIIDGSLYTNIPNAGEYMKKPDYKNSVITYYDGNNATVEFEISVEYESSVKTANVTLVKTSDGWKINGGTYFTVMQAIAGEWHFDSVPPSTGENTILYLAIAAAALAAMTALVVRRKRKIVL